MPAWLHLLENQEQLMRLARESFVRDRSATDFVAAAATYAAERPEVLRLVWLDANRHVLGRYAPRDIRDEGPSPSQVPPTAARREASVVSDWAFLALRDQRQPVYSRIFRDDDRAMVFQLMAPVLERGRFAGALAADISVDGLLRHVVPADVSQRHPIAIVDEQDQVVAGLVTPMPGSGKPRRAVETQRLENNEIFLTVITHDSDDPFCCPTLATKRHYRLINNQLEMTDYVTFTPDGRPRTITIESPVNGAEVFSSVQIQGSVAIAPFENNLAYRIYDVGGVELSAGAVVVTAPHLGAPGTFEAAITLGGLLSGSLIRIEIQDISAVDGALLAMDSVELVVK